MIPSLVPLIAMQATSLTLFAGPMVPTVGCLRGKRISLQSHWDSSARQTKQYRIVTPCRHFNQQY